MAKILINDLFEELFTENKRLSNELNYSLKCIEFLNNYRKCLLDLNESCVCNQIGNNLLVDTLEGQYQHFVIHDKPKTLVVTKSEPKASTDDNNEIQHSDTNSGDNECQSIDEEPSDDNQWLSDNDLSDDTMSDHSSDTKPKKQLTTRRVGRRGGGEGYVCDYVGCDRWFGRKDNLKRHRECHSDTKPSFECIDCHKKYRDKSSLRKHRIRHHKPYIQTQPDSTDTAGVYACDWIGCEKTFATEAMAERHRQYVHKERREVIECELCGQEYTDKSGLRRHLIRHHTPQPKLFHCREDECWFQTKSKPLMARHRRLHHRYDRPAVCEVVGCDKEFSSRFAMEGHMRSMHITCQCKLCDQEFVGKQALSAHMRSHSVGAMFRCSHPGCDYESYNSGNIAEHRLRHQNIRDFRCEYADCGKTFITARHLQRHALVHSDVRPFTCDWPGCEAAFKLMEPLNRHRLTHEGIRQFKCTHTACDKSFVTRNGLWRHKMSHLKDKPYGCDWPECGQRFASNQTLKIHVNEHQGLRPYSCQYSGCDKSFSGKPGLRQHMKVGHKQNSYEWNTSLT